MWGRVGRASGGRWRRLRRRDRSFRTRVAELETDEFIFVLRVGREFHEGGGVVIEAGADLGRDRGKGFFSSSDAVLRIVEVEGFEVAVQRFEAGLRQHAGLGVALDNQIDICLVGLMLLRQRGFRAGETSLT